MLLLVLGLLLTVADFPPPLPSTKTLSMENFSHPRFQRRGCQRPPAMTWDYAYLLNLLQSIFVKKLSADT